MPELSDSIKKKLAALASEFTQKLPDRLERIDAGIRGLREGTAGLDRIQELHIDLHKLSGSGATFGYAELSSIAKNLETVIMEVITKDGFFGQREQGLVDSYYKELTKECESVLPQEILSKISEQAEKAASMKSEDRGDKFLYFLTFGFLDFPEDLETQLGYFGYSVIRRGNLEELGEELKNPGQHIVLIHTDCIENNLCPSEEIEELKTRYSSHVYFIYISAKGDFDTRLDAVRAGSDAFFQEPVDVGRLIYKIDRFTCRHSREPYHILIVDDDPDQVSFHALILQQAGMITSVALDPKQVVKVLVEAKPELVLIDMYMPGCSGLELASIIRQQEAFISIPIVFLSIEKDLDKQFAAIKRGGDDFLVKPIKDEHLIESISSRAERTRSLRYLMERDSLTGLLNHSNLKEQIVREMRRANRTESTVCFAMIDVDHFKTVNDSFGHLTGDRVIKGLAQLLHERLRSTDIIGRYGGEEFGVILLNTSLKDAKRVIDDIRERFSLIKQQSENGEFTVTFSCGIAAYPDFQEPASLSEAADQALYEAKETGRNRVVIRRAG